MKVLIINYEYPPVGGGAGIVTRQIARRLPDFGCYPTVLTSQGQSKNADFQDDGVNLIHVLTNRRSDHQTGIRAMVEFLVKGTNRARKLIAYGEYDLIHYIFSVPSGLISFALPNSIPSIVSLHGGDVPGYNPGQMERLHRVLKPLNKRVWKKANIVTAVCDELGTCAKSISRNLNYQVIYNGVDTEFFQPSDGLQRQGGKLKLICITRLIELKGLQYLIDAIGQLDESSVELTIAGTGEYEAQLKRRVSDKKLDNHIHFLGQVSHEAVRKLYNEADVFVFPSYGDAFPISVLEAMACGLPVIATDYGGAKEIITHGDNGLIVRSRDIAELVKAIRYLSQETNLRENMGRRGRLIASQKYSWDTIVRQYVDVYRTASGAGRERRIDRFVL